MKLSLRFASILLALFPALGFAGSDSHKASINISSSVQVGGAQLPAGEYTIRWDGTGPASQLKIFSGGKVVATVPVRVAALQQKPSQDGVETSTNSGVTTITRIQFEGKSYALEVSPDSTGAVATSGSSVK